MKMAAGLSSAFNSDELLPAEDLPGKFAAGDGEDGERGEQPCYGAGGEDGEVSAVGGDGGECVGEAVGGDEGDECGGEGAGEFWELDVG